jgi:hypothetical protein
MARFNLNDYATVEERLRTFWAGPNNQDARIVTVNHTTPADRSVSTWVVEARLYLSAGDQANDLPKTTGWAFEVDGGSGPQSTSALEVCETSAIGRCLANYIYSGSKRPSREEMAKVEKGVTPQPVTDWLAKSDSAADIDKIRLVYAQAKAQGAPKEVLDQIKARGESFNTGSKDSGAGTRGAGVAKGRATK